MKKSKIVLAVSSLMFAGSVLAQSSVTLYGIADVSVRYTTNATRATTAKFK